MATKSKLEYIWLDGFEPTQSLRSKTMIETDFSGKLDDCKDWSFDGSSTLQAEGGSSDCVLKPVAIYPDPDRLNGFLVMCEVYNADGTPHSTNGRATIDEDDDDFWFGYEQEYFLWDPETDLPLGFPRDATPQGQFYCSVGAENAYGREVIETHLDMCLEAGINVEGINAEVAVGQWEFQIFAKGAKNAGDEVWVARYLAERKRREVRPFYSVAPEATGADRLERLRYARELLRYHSEDLWRRGHFQQGLRGIRQEHREAHQRIRRAQRAESDWPT